MLLVGDSYLLCCVFYFLVSPRMGCHLDMMDAAPYKATWPGYTTPGVSPASRPPSNPHWHLKDPSSPFLSHSHHAAHTNKDLRVFMAQRSETSRSPQLQPCPIQKPSYRPPCLTRSLIFSRRLPLGSFCSLLCSPALVRSLPSRFGAFWCEPSVLELLPSKTPPSFMPRPRGRPRHGAAWYQARGRKPPPSDPPCEASSPPRAVSPHCDLASSPPLAPMDVHPSEEGFPPPLAHLVMPSPSKPPCDPVTGLSPLSNPYDCRVEWFDLLGNSLGYAPPPPLPLDVPPFRHPPSSLPRRFTFFPSSGLLFLFSALQPPFSFRWQGRRAS
jgi:hypothetical protein